MREENRKMLSPLSSFLTSSSKEHHELTIDKDGTKIM